jgi:hypothetical protein
MKSHALRCRKYSSVSPLLLAAILSASLVSGCGGDADPAAAGADGAAAQTSATPVQSPAQAPDPDAAARHSVPSEYSSRDSAGVQIIETAGSAWTAESVWTIDPQPIADLGGSRAPGTALHGAGRIVPLSDGGFAVAHRRGNQIVWFDANGRFLHTAGRFGRSPGGFMILGDVLAMPGDSVLAIDPEIERLSVFGPDGEFARLESIDFVEAGSPSALGVLPDGSILGMREFGFEDGMTAGVNRDTLPFVILQPGGGYENTASAFPTSEHWLFNFGDGLAGGALPFGSESEVAATADGFWFGSGDAPTVTYQAADGRLLKILRWDSEPDSLPAERVAAFKAAAMATVAGNPPAVAEIRNFLQDMPFPATSPYTGRMIVDPDGALWIGPYRAWTEPAGGLWTVFDADGRRLGMVDIPAGFEIRAIGPDRVYGVWTDDERIESVRVYALNR